MTDLYHRSGTLFTGRVIDADTAKPYAMIQYPCCRCGGQGGSEAWKFTGWTCYRCNGACLDSPRRVPLYTADRLARLDATLAKRTAAKVAKVMAARALVEAEANARRIAFQAVHADVLAWLEQAGRNAGEYREGFLGDMLRCALERAQWSPAQQAAVYASHAKNRARDAVRAGSQHVGQTGERIAVTATVERVSYFDRRRFGYDNKYETVYITTLRDGAGNAIVVKSTQFAVRAGSVLTLKGTVKEHGEYRGEAQTVLQRVALLSEQLPDAIAA
jgi:hypothetical protein